LGLNHGAAPNSYDCLPLLASFSNRLSFQFPELALSFLAKNLGDRFPALLDYRIIGVQEIPIQSLGCLFTHQRFTGARETRDYEIGNSPAYFHQSYLSVY
jgi:hypothetical protein